MSQPLGPGRPEPPWLREIQRDVRQNEERMRALLAAIEPVRVQIPEIPQIQIPRIQWRSEELLRQIRDLAERAREEWERSAPDNWRGMELDQVERITELMDETGWSLVWVPSGDTIRRLLASKTKEPARRLVRFEGRILADLEACLAEVSAAELRHLRDALDEALGAHRERRYRAAQSLTASVLTASIHEYFDPPTLGGTRTKGGRQDPQAVAIRGYRRALVFRRVAGALENFAPGTDPIPTRFNRHACAHTVAPGQYTRANCLAGLMLGVSVVREIERELKERAGGI
jgi:hypothetical protein